MLDCLRVDVLSPFLTCSIPTLPLIKVLLGSTVGQLGLWNVKTGRHVYEFKNHGVETGDAVTSLRPSPALDVTAVGTRSGIIYLLNLKKDEVKLAAFIHSHRVRRLCLCTPDFF